ncbi:MAG: zinc dependent phospholipase C family protein [Candidatus Aenigmarchaeota archaeon]|nr:zinc dependent phospholipase C family protein [Candidatus Aenigmarchaeota archaeon]
MKFLIMFMIVILLIPSAHSWGYKTHEWLCKKLYENNQDLKKMIVDEEEFLRGCIAPDKEYDDQKDHHCYVSKECKEINISDIDPGNLPYFKDIEDCTGEEYFDCPALIKFDEAIKNATASNFSFYIGVSTHYMTDSFVPVHQIMGEDYYKCHAPFEEHINNKLKSNEKNWEVSVNCDVYFPCKKLTKAVRKCENSYNVQITFAYDDILEVLKKTDSSISRKLNLTEGNYENLPITGNTAGINEYSIIKAVLTLFLLILLVLFAKNRIGKSWKIYRYMKRKVINITTYKFTVL